MVGSDNIEGSFGIYILRNAPKIFLMGDIGLHVIILTFVCTVSRFGNILIKSRLGFSIKYHGLQKAL